ncbi:hypothetical protein F5Y14DRAFT_443917 [Nemania sp. NC0429]|nr:hypothetical protein F5Y14DRAFT_443917 [Nemania sp. NC0429]
MDHVPAHLSPQSDEDKFLDVPYAQRWDHLMSVIVELYMGNYGRGGKATTLSQVVDFMKKQYSFHATPKQYRTHLDAWGVKKKKLPGDVKDDITHALARRKRPGTSTSHITITKGGRDDEHHPSKYIRHLREQGRRRPIESIMPGVLTSFNLPYEAFIASIYKTSDKPSPFGPLATTPDNVNIESPESLTPGREAAGPSPNMELVYQRAREARATLFVQGRLEDLAVGMCTEDRKLVLNYFHDFFMSGFIMAKEWGKKSPDRLAIAGPVPSPEGWPRRISTTPSDISNPPSIQSSLEFHHFKDLSRPPTQLCNWCIHVPSARGDARCTSMPLSDEGWGNPSPTSSFPNELHRSMESGSFSDLPVPNLPLERDIILRAIESDPRALKVDAWKLAIMAGNHILLKDMFEQDSDEVPEGLDEIYPFHLAASFLDGAHACCKVFEMLSRILDPTYAFSHNIDGHGHTILDTLIVSILRSHTRISPDFVSHAFRSSSRFPGEEMDICGRWGPDTPRVRELFHQGFARIPNTWKHPFCHTAVQAVCHSIISIYGPSCAPDINRLSGLFIRRCTECGLELKLGPLHTLVVAAFHLAQLGMPGETLFGAVAVLVCLLSLGGNATLRVNISVDDILGTSVGGRCSHASTSPSELIQKVPEHVIGAWTDACRVGWNCFAEILSQAEEHEHSKHNESDSQSDHSDSDWRSESVEDPGETPERCEFMNRYYGKVHGGWLKLECQTADMGLVWATIQTELLTYRRVKEGESWISENFSLEALEDWLFGHTAEFRTPLVQDQMMEPHTKCGWFKDAETFVCPCAQEVSANYFMNMDIYARSTYIGISLLEEIWEDIDML